MMLFPNLSLADFKARYYRQRPLLVRGGAPFLLGRLYLPSEFDSWRRQMEQKHPPYVYDTGPMVGVVRVSSFVPELQQVADRFTHEFPGMIAAFDSFRTFAVRGGTVGSHFDDNDNFILQQVGTKLWKVAPPAHVHPESARARAMRGERLGQVIMADEHVEFDLHAGDALYVPSFWIHWGVGLDEGLSLSLALNPVDTAQLLREAEIYPRVQGYTPRPQSSRPPLDDPAPGLARLASWARCPVPTGEGPKLWGVELLGLLESSWRRELAGLLDMIPSLVLRPSVRAHGEYFAQGLARLGMLDEDRVEAFLASNLFAFLAERAQEAISYADGYKLREMGDVLTEVAAVLQGSERRAPEAVLGVLGGVPTLPELAGARSILPAWRVVEALDPVIARLGSRFAPVAARAVVDVDERLQELAAEPSDVLDRAMRSLTLRTGTPCGPESHLIEGPEYQAVYALGHRAGRALARALPAFDGFLAGRDLAELSLPDLRLLSAFCHVYGLLACSGLAERARQSSRAFAFAESARASAAVVLADPRVTKLARGALEGSIAGLQRSA